MTTESSTSRVIGTLIKYKGEEFVKRLRAQEIRLFKASSAGFLDLIAAGEVAGSFVVFQNQVTVKKEKKAPIDWVPLDGVPTNAGGRLSLQTRRIRMRRCFSPILSSALKVRSLWSSFATA